ncbi:hypothetical protein [Pseudomonas sp. PS02290]|uniref:hypothetical protein n=1 Tax=Pseudomonas sp. PS02290 TaxID=2991430 RepID=UPI00249CF0E8|nr:hypothetical protein [Pseudomonas sp. PS02290]
MSKTNVVSFAEKKAEFDCEAAFLDHLDADIKNHPDSVKPLSRSLIGRINGLRAKAEMNRRRELLEG